MLAVLRDGVVKTRQFATSTEQKRYLPFCALLLMWKSGRTAGHRQVSEVLDSAGLNVKCGKEDSNLHGVNPH